jgi:hypothetical protein
MQPIDAVMGLSVIGLAINAAVFAVACCCWLLTKRKQAESCRSEVYAAQSEWRR